MIIYHLDPNYILISETIYFGITKIISLTYNPKIISTYFGLLGDIIALITKTIQRTLKKEELKQIMSFQFDAFDDYYKDDKIAIIGELLYYFLKLVKNKKLNP